jgi:NifB/MoaA-like Fe-S oxidoreductase
VTQRLSPYNFRACHDDAVRRGIFRLKRPDNLLEKIAFLAKNRIDLHTQIVLMPGINDGAILEKTLADLYIFRKSILSVAIVPVGLTAHRRNLLVIKAVDTPYAGQFLTNISRWNRQYQNRDGEYWVFPADEFYLLAGRKLPGSKYYGSFYQIENGIGLVRDFLDDFKRQVGPAECDRRKRKVLFITGALAAPVIGEHVAPRLNQMGIFMWTFFR